MVRPLYGLGEFWPQVSTCIWLSPALVRGHLNSLCSCAMDWVVARVRVVGPRHIFPWTCVSAMVALLAVHYVATQLPSVGSMLGTLPPSTGKTKQALRVRCCVRLRGGKRTMGMQRDADRTARSGLRIVVEGCLLQACTALPHNKGFCMVTEEVQ